MTVTLLGEAPDLTNLKSHHNQKDTSLLIHPPLAGHDGAILGEISVCEDQLYFYSETANSGIAVAYPDIIIHATSRNEDQPHIYCQLDVGLFFPNQQLPEDEDERDDCVTELRFIPRDPGALEGIYMAMSECAALHPDHEFMAEQESEEEEDGEELSERQQAALAHLESVFVPSMNGHSNDEFNDADEEQY